MVYRSLNHQKKSLGNLNGLNHEIVGLAKTVLNECLNKNNNIEEKFNKFRYNHKRKE